MNVKRSIVVTPPASEPIGIADIAKLHLKLDGTEEDTLLAIWVQAAREKIEERTGRSLITQGRVIKLDHFPHSYEIELTYGPVQADSIVIKYLDESEVEQTLSDADYWVDTDSPIARVRIKNSWPATKCMPNAVSIAYDAGYGDTAEEIPAALISACLLRFAHLYENRQSVVLGTSTNEVPLGEDDLIGPYILTQDAFY